MRLGIKVAGSWDELSAACRVAEESGFDLVSCWDHIAAASRRPIAQSVSRAMSLLGDQRARELALAQLRGPRRPRSEWDAASLLIALGAKTSRVQLGVHVLNTAIRQPLFLASQIALAQAVSGGRIEAGLGAGGSSVVLDHETIGAPLSSLRERTQRLAAFCEALPRLLSGEEVSDDRLGLRRARLGVLGVPTPPIVIGGNSKPVLEVAARFAKGWNAHDVDPVAFRSLADGLAEECERIGRAEALDLQVQLLVTPSDIPSLRARIESFAEAGAATAVLVPLGVEAEEGVLRIAEATL